VPWLSLNFLTNTSLENRFAFTSPRVDKVSLEQRVDVESEVSNRTVVMLFLVIAILTILLRIFYAGYLFEDDGLWFAAGEELLRGKALYREIYFDKPPGIAFTYAFLFKVFGAHILTIRLFTIAYSIAMSFALYLFAAVLYDRRVGMVAALMFAVFSTTYQTGHFQGLNTDFLMVLPYTLGAFWFIRAIRGDYRLAFVGGLASGIALQINPKGVFDLIFFVALLVGLKTHRAASGYDVNENNQTIGASGDLRLPVARRLALFLVALGGLILGAIPFVVIIAKERALQEYWSSVWAWGLRYARYHSLWQTLSEAVTQTAQYLALNSALLFGVGIVIAARFRRVRVNSGQASRASYGTAEESDADAALLIWLAVSYVAVATGGRFYGHYFFQILPSLCIIGARGLTLGLSILKRPTATRAALVVRRTAMCFAALIVIGFAVTLARFHGRTVVLAGDRLRGHKSSGTKGWFHERLNREERVVAALVRGIDLEQNDVDAIGLEGIRTNGPRERGVIDGADYLFVWGYRPEIYFWSGLLPASRYLSTQQLTGVPGDVHFSPSGHPILDEQTTAEARAQLLRELQSTRPKYVIDELGFYNPNLTMDTYPELAEYLDDYKPLGSVGRFLVYLRKEYAKKHRSHQRAAN
jgi:dolichyl-phosphate-mannose-protein mannosyltransferase